MNIEYRRDTHHSYMVLYETEKIERISFQKRMFLENRIPGFLDCKMHQVNQRQRFYYEISSKQSIGSILETKTMNLELLEALVRSLLQALDGLQQYLLDTDSLYLQPECIFLDPATNTFEFCYYPDGTFLWKEQLQELAKYLLPRLDHKNHDTVCLGYALYQCAMEGKFTGPELEKLLKNHTDGPEPVIVKQHNSAQKTDVMKTEENTRKAVPVFPENRSELLQAFFESEEELPAKSPLIVFPEDEEGEGKRRVRLKQGLLLVVPVLLGAVGAFAFWFLAFKLAAIFCAVSGFIVFLVVLFFRIKKGRDKETEATMEQYVMVQDWLEEERQEENEYPERKAGIYTAVNQETEIFPEEGATCLLSSEVVRKKLAHGYLVPDSTKPGDVIPVEKEVTMIGKSSHMDVVLHAMGVSRTHARITCREGKCFLTDLNSRNGTCLNGLLLNPREQQLLSDGDQILFADQGYVWKTFQSHKNDTVASHDLWWNE